MARDKPLNKEYDAAHMLTPMPLAMSLGVGSTAVPFVVAAVENVNGQAITLHVDHKSKRDPKQWKGFKFAVPFRRVAVKKEDAHEEERNDRGYPERKEEEEA